jgi:hypothetical protein
LLGKGVKQGGKWHASSRGYLACAASGGSFKLITAENSTAIKLARVYTGWQNMSSTNKLRKYYATIMEEVNPIAKRKSRGAVLRQRPTPQPIKFPKKPASK